jgi:hypothetical protein
MRCKMHWIPNQSAWDLSGTTEPQVKSATKMQTQFYEMQDALNNQSAWDLNGSTEPLNFASQISIKDADPVLRCTKKPISMGFKWDHRTPQFYIFRPVEPKARLPKGIGRPAETGMLR